MNILLIRNGEGFEIQARSNGVMIAKSIDKQTLERLTIIMQIMAIDVDREKIAICI